MNPKKFFAELKRRNVYKVAVAYAVVAWLLMQIATQIFPFFEIPNWAVRLVVLLLIIGFPVALTLAWAFELTPEGIKRAEDVAPSESITHRTGQKLIALIVFVAVIAAVLLLLQLTRHKPAVATGNSAAASAAPKAALEVIPEKSIAVLPFENLSRDPDNSYFATGIQDEILTRLAKIGALKVISRSSTQQYQSRPGNLVDIARELGAAHFLEGSVQKAANAVHVNVQLIRAATGDHLWAESYDRKLDDIFAVEAEVAGNIAAALNAKLTGAEQQVLAEKPTNSPEAYDAYLHAVVEESRGWSSNKALEEAAELYGQATKLDPNFAQAWARLARADAWMVFRNQDTSKERRNAVEQALATAVKLQPDSTETLLAQTYYHYWMLRDYKEAKVLFEQLRTRLPNNSEVPYALSAIARRQGLWDQSLGYSEQAIALNPRDTELFTDRAWTYQITRQFPEAIKTLNRVLEITPNDFNAVVQKALLYQTQGQLDQARQLLAGVPSDQRNDNAITATIRQWLLDRDYSSLITTVPEFLKNSGINATDRAGCRAAIGWAELRSRDIAAARHTFTQARSEFEAVRTRDPANPDNAGALAMVYAALGEKELALKEAQRGLTLLPASKDAVLGPGGEEALARVEAQVGENDRAIGRLQHLLTVSYAGDYGLPITRALLRLHPYWDPLRNDPRFQKLCEEKQP